MRPTHHDEDPEPLDYAGRNLLAPRRVLGTWRELASMGIVVLFILLIGCGLILAAGVWFVRSVLVW